MARASTGAVDGQGGQPGSGARPAVKKKGKRRIKREKATVGWREWVAFPELGIDRINAKIDSGAKTSALHAFRPQEVRIDGVDYVEFYVHPKQRHREPEIFCRAELVDKRLVTSSNGMQQNRYVVATQLAVGGRSYRIELTLTDRDEMSFRVLIGREALKRRFVIDPGKSYLMGH